MAQMSKAGDLTSGPMLKKIILFSLPLAASSFLQLLFNAADVVVVGRFVGSAALAAVGSNGAKVCGAAEKIAPKLARPFCYNTAYQHPSNLIFYGFRPLVFNQGTVSRQKNQAAFLRPRRFMVPAVALAASKITVLLSG